MLRSISVTKAEAHVCTNTGLPRSPATVHLDTDAIEVGIGTVLAQSYGEKGTVVAYANRILKKAEWNYSTTKKELMGMVIFTRYFRHVFLGKEFLLQTDHNSLKWLYNFDEPQRQLAWWLE